MKEHSLGIIIIFFNPLASKFFETTIFFNKNWNMVSHDMHVWSDPCFPISGSSMMQCGIFKGLGNQFSADKSKLLRVLWEDLTLLSASRARILTSCTRLFVNSGNFWHRFNKVTIAYTAGNQGTKIHRAGEPCKA